MKTSLSTAFAAILVGFQPTNAFKYPDCANGPLANTTVCDPKASPPDRAAALVKAMNISEKLVNLVEYANSTEIIAWFSRAEADGYGVVKVKALQDLAYLRMRGGAKLFTEWLTLLVLALIIRETPLDTPRLSRIQSCCRQRSTMI